MPIIKLSQDFFDNPPPSEGRKTEWCDADFPGLIMEVRTTAPGRGTLAQRYKDPITGRNRYVRIGSTTDMNLVEARKRAKKLKAEIHLGADPRGEAKARSQIPTMTAFFEEFYRPFAEPRKRSFARDEQLFRLRIKDRFGHRQLSNVARHEVQTFHTQLMQSGLAEATADHHVKLLKRMYNLAISWEIFQGPNPIVGVQLANPDNRVERYLSEEELKRFVALLLKDGSCASMAILWLAHTGARVGETLASKWQDIDRANRIWRIPATNSKSKKVRTVPLSEGALEVLSSIGTEGRYEHVFVNERSGRPRATIAKAFDKLCKQAGIPNFRIHDVRHDWASRAVRAGLSLFVVQQVLGHSDPKTTQRYAHLDQRTLQAAAKAASAQIDVAMEKAKAA